MSNIVELIKKIADGVIEQKKLATVMTGTLTSKSPVRVRITDKLILTNANLIKTTAFSDLNVGDTVVLIRQQGGQKYLIVDKVV